MRSITLLLPNLAGSQPFLVLAMPSGSATPLVHIGHVRLFCDIARQLFVLIHLLTGEHVALPAGGRWGLHFADDGFAYVSNEADPSAEARWVDEFLTMQAFVAGGRFCIRRPKGEGHEIKWLDDLKNERRQDLSVEVNCPPHRAFGLQANLLGMAADGARIWWSLPAIYSALEMKAHGGRAGKWTSHGWQAWANLCEQLGLATAHLRKGVAHDGMGNLGADLSTTDRVFQERCVSTHLLVALLSRWGSASTWLHLKAETERECAKGLLKSLISLALDGHKSAFAVYSGRDEKWAPPEFPSGECPIVVLVDGMFVDLTAVYRSKELGVVEALKLTPSTCRRALSSVLLDLAGSAQSAWLFKQIVWWLGTTLEEHWSQNLVDSALETRLNDRTDAQRQKALVQYWVATLKAFDQAANVSISLDASRIGQKNTVCGILAMPDNRAVIFPPQAPGVACQSGGLETLSLNWFSASLNCVLRVTKFVLFLAFSPFVSVWGFFSDILRRF